MPSAAPSNPLTPFVLRALRETPAGMSEYELLQHIEAAGAPLDALGNGLANVTADASLALFQKHFLLMNALYRLQQSLWRDEQVWLAISPLRIAFEHRAPGAGHAIAMGVDGGLRDYYLDWSQLETTDRAAVDQLLAGFWQRFHARDGRAAALAVLELDIDAEWAAIKRQYRRLAAATHPDRGGDSTRFLAIREAYEILSAINSE